MKINEPRNAKDRWYKWVKDKKKERSKRYYWHCWGNSFKQVRSEVQKTV